MSQIVLMKRAGVTFDAEEGRWVTTKTGKHVHLNEKGEPDKGNPKVVKEMKKGGGEKQSNAEPHMQLLEQMREAHRRKDIDRLSELSDKAYARGTYGKYSSAQKQEIEKLIKLLDDDFWAEEKRVSEINRRRRGRRRRGYTEVSLMSS